MRQTERYAEQTTATLLAAADQCVKCALCLPHCPTYQHHADENESPRGRIALAEALLKEQITINASVRRHLDSCLTCGRCETVCPSRVPYTRLLHGIRQRWPSRIHWARALLHHPAWLTRVAAMARRLPDWRHWPLPIRLARALGLQSPLPPIGTYPCVRAHDVCPDLQPPLPASSPHLCVRAHGVRPSPQLPLPDSGTYPPTATTSPRRLGLLLGCATRAVQANALWTSIRLLNALGYTLEIPPQQGCCGALAVHQGAQQQADTSEQQNRTAFAGTEAIISIASGCVAGSPLALTDIVTFLAQHQAALHQLNWRPLPYSVVLHQPCTSRAGRAVADLLACIPQMQVQTLADGCCGAAGDHLIRQRGQAIALRQPMLDRVPDTATHLVTTNVGCALHLAEGLQQQGQTINVRHPAELLAESLGIG
ncbi:MAG: heterodisulfide reductase-related iron-sulfur binding cluster [Pseudomonadota bacterium]